MKRKIVFDGLYWIHASEKFCLIHPNKKENFEEECQKHISLFTREYFPKTGDVVFDVGSWNGAELPVWSRAVGESGHVYAIEADPEFYKQSLKVVKLLNLKNVTCINKAIMDKEGYITISSDRVDGLDSGIYGNKEKNKINVPSTTIDKILQDYNIEKVDYLKMNIEGAEEFAVQGIQNLSKIKNWCISTHDFCGIPTKKFVTSFFEEHKFEVINYPHSSPTYLNDYIYVK